MSSAVKAVACCALILLIPLCLIVLWAVVQRSASMGKDAEYSYSDVYDKVQFGEVLDAVIQGNELRGHLKTSPKDEFRTILPANYDELLKAMLAAKVNFTIKPARSNFLLPLLINLGPIALVLLLLVPPFWRIFKRAGFQPMLSVLMMVPPVNLFLLYFVAFSEWKAGPAQKS
jgi:ATP-dependent Zn protease